MNPFSVLPFFALILDQKLGEHSDFTIHNMELKCQFYMHGICLRKTGFMNGCESYFLGILYPCIQLMTNTDLWQEYTYDIDYLGCFVMQPC